MGGIEPLIVLPVAAFHLSVVPWRIRFNEFMVNPVCSQTLLKQRRFIPMSGKAVGKLRSIVCLDTLDLTGERF